MVFLETWQIEADQVFRNYLANKKILAEMKDNVIYGSSGRGGNTAPPSRVSDPTGQAVIRLTSHEITVLTAKIKAVDAVLHELGCQENGDRKAGLIALVYWKGKSLKAAAACEMISTRTAKRWKKEACEMLAAQLGLLT